MTIHKIFAGTIDEEVHQDFLKFGRGEYKDRFLLAAKKQAKGWTIKTGPEFVNFLVGRCLEKAPGTIQLSGIIVSTTDLSEELPFEIVKKSNFQGIRKIQINTEAKTEEVRALLTKHPRAFFALSFTGDDFALKVKAKAPKSGKPGKESEEGPKADFCTLKTPNKEIVETLFFDIETFKEITISHTVIVETIVYPQNMETLKPTEVREQSKRKGRIIRNITVDGTSKTSETTFTA